MTTHMCDAIEDQVIGKWHARLDRLPSYTHGRFSSHPLLPYFGRLALRISFGCKCWHSQLRMLNFSSHMAINVDFVINTFTDRRRGQSSQKSRTRPYAVDPYKGSNAIIDSCELFVFISSIRSPSGEEQRCIAKR